VPRMATRSCCTSSHRLTAGGQQEGQEEGEGAGSIDEGVGKGSGRGDSKA
jgi:hypothetical protein